ncbi:hypothetical protein B0H11DRAFT_1966054 [Mycena galericulata]|nr:hypothetical protein B0H11DRAFT_1966054 [Mycena galericulata]
MQLASNSLNDLDAASPPALGGIPQWAVDIQNLLRHEQKWESHVIKVLLYNSDIAQREQAEWNLARILNSTCKRDAEPLTLLPLPLERLVVPDIPPPPVPGAAVNLPPIFDPVPVVIPAAHVLFPASNGALRDLTSPQLITLLAAYNCPGSDNVAGQRFIFARHIGVHL